MYIDIIAKIIIPLFSAVLMYVLVPYINSKTTKEQRDDIKFYVGVAVRAAEQIYNEKGQGRMKKKYVIEYLRQKGFDITDSDVEVLIEAAVLEMKKFEGR